MQRRDALILTVCLVVIGVLTATALGIGPLWDGLFGDEPEIEDGTENRPSSPDSSDTPTDADTTTPEPFEPPDPSTVPGKLQAEPTGFAGFEEIAEAVGLSYETAMGGAKVYGQQGVYVVDFNNNGYEDLLLVGGERPVLFENTGGGFEVATEFDVSGATAAHFFDHNNDGSRDLLLAPRRGELRFFENVNAEFIERPDVIQGGTGIPTSITSGDFTGNGCLDLYIGDGGTTGKSALTIDEMLAVAQRHPEIRPTTDTGASNHLFAGNCESFEDRTDDFGIGGSSVTLAVSAADMTGNGYPDIHVANDFTGDFLYENTGERFRRLDMGPASDRNAMSSVLMDVTGNHRLDIFNTNIYYEGTDPEELVPTTRVSLPHGNNLFTKEGNGTFTDIAPEHGLEKGSWGWAATIADYTNDGHLDVIHASSFADVAAAENHPDIFRPPQVWKGTGETWEKVNGFDIGFPEHNIRGVARVDYNFNGALDFVSVGGSSLHNVPGVDREDDRAFLYENQLDSDDWLQLWIRNPSGLERNAGVYVETDQRTIYREANARSDLLSQDSRLLHIGTANENIKRVVVAWPDGQTTVHDELVEGNRYILTPGTAERVD